MTLSRTSIFLFKKRIIIQQSNFNAAKILNIELVIGIVYDSVHFLRKMVLLYLRVCLLISFISLNMEISNIIILKRLASKKSFETLC